MLEVLVVDDEQAFGEMLRTLLDREGYSVTYLDNAATALDHVAAGQFDVVLCDIKMPHMSGTEFLKALAQRDLKSCVIMMSAYGSLDTAIECVKLGANDYISKPFKAEELLLKLQKVAEHEGLRNENKRLKRQLKDGYGFDHIIGKSEPMRRLFATIDKIADYKSTVLISGESGTGKELVARAIHYNSHRAKKPFVAVNCGAIPEQLLESELFGYVRGAFTDAIRDKRGMFEEANTGTLFLDEIGELPLSLQVKLLRAIQEEEIRRVGDARPMKVDIRLVAATVRDLREDVKNKLFREDLYYRLNVLPIDLPPLRMRPDDIPLLVEAFMAKSSKRLGKRITTMRPDAMKLLTEYNWPGNVRELENTIERASVFAEGEIISTEELPDHVRLSADRVRLTLANDELSIKKTTRIIEEELIRRALTKTRGNRTAAAKLLEISHRALLYKIKDYEVDIPPGGAG